MKKFLFVIVGIVFVFSLVTWPDYVVPGVIIFIVLGFITVVIAAVTTDPMFDTPDGEEDKE